MPVQSWSQILDIVFELANKKSSLREECGWILYGAVQESSSKGGDVKHMQLIIDKLQENNLAKTPEGVAIWIKVQTNIPDVVLPAGVWHHDDPLDKKETAGIAKILKESVNSDLDQPGTSNKTSQKGHWTSKLHFAWDVVISQLLESEHTRKARSLKRQKFEGFWEVCVDSEWSPIAVV